MKRIDTIAIRDKQFIRAVRMEAKRREQKRLTYVVIRLAEERLVEIKTGQLHPISLDPVLQR